jgi:hypothetical protein
MKNECVLTDRLVYSAAKMSTGVFSSMSIAASSLSINSNSSRHTWRQTQQRRLLFGELSDDRA